VAWEKGTGGGDGVSKINLLKCLSFNQAPGGC